MKIHHRNHIRMAPVKAARAFVLMELPDGTLFATELRGPELNIDVDHGIVEEDSILTCSATPSARAVLDGEYVRGFAWKGAIPDEITQTRGELEAS